MAAARAAEYLAVIEQATAVAALCDAERGQATRTLRAELRRIRRRDFFPPAERDAAVAAVDALARAAEPGGQVPGAGAVWSRGGRQ